MILNASLDTSLTKIKYVNVVNFLLRNNKLEGKVLWIIMNILRLLI